MEQARGIVDSMYELLRNRHLLDLITISLIGRIIDKDARLNLWCGTDAKIESHVGNEVQSQDIWFELLNFAERQALQCQEAVDGFKVNGGEVELRNTLALVDQEYTEIIAKYVEKKPNK